MDSLGVLPSALPPAVAARSATPKEIIEHLQLTSPPSLLVHAGLFVLHVSTSLDTLLLSMCFIPGLRVYRSMQVSGHILNAVEGNTAQDYGRAQRFKYLECTITTAEILLRSSMLLGQARKTTSAGSAVILQAAETKDRDAESDTLQHRSMPQMIAKGRKKAESKPRIARIKLEKDLPDKYVETKS